MSMEHPLLLNISVLFEVNGLRAERHLYIQDRYMRGQWVGLLAGTSLFKTVLTSPYLCFPSSVKRKGGVGRLWVEIPLSPCSPKITPVSCLSITTNAQSLVPFLSLSRIRPGELILRNCDGANAAANQEPAGSVRGAQHLSKCPHAVVFVVKANDPRLKDGKYKETLKKIREHFREDGR